MKPGDVIGFSEDGSGAAGSFGHIGIYVGGGKMIHAPRPGKNVEIVVDIAQDLPMIAGDVVKLYQVFTNLIANAIKFTDQGQIVVSAALSNSASIRIEVKDSGIGIAEQALARIWQPFEQADDAISSRFGGTGLGLSLAKALIELHKGTVGVNSKLGEGACFWVTLPIAQIAAAA